MSNEITTTSSKEIEALFGGAGFGSFTDEVKFPFLSIASKTTDLAVEGSPKYIEGMKPGFLYNSLTKRIYGKTLQVIILDYDPHVYKEYTPDNSSGEVKRGDFVREVPKSEIATFSPQQIADFTKNFLPSGNLLEEFKVFYLVLPQFPEDGIMKFEFTKGSFKHVRNWGNMVLRTSHPYPSHIWELTTGMSTQKVGNKVYSYFSIGDDSTTFVKDLGTFIDNKDLVRDVKDGWELVQSIRAQEKTSTPKQVEKQEPDSDPAF